MSDHVYVCTGIYFAIYSFDIWRKVGLFFCINITYDCIEYTPSTGNQLIRWKHACAHFWNLPLRTYIICAQKGTTFAHIFSSNWTHCFMNGNFKIYMQYINFQIYFNLLTRMNKVLKYVTIGSRWFSFFMDSILKAII